MDLETAEKFFSLLFEKRNSTQYPFSEKHQRELDGHGKKTAEIAAKIAQNTAYLNSEKAYIYGLLHDYGRITDEYAEKKFHGLVGYFELLEEYPDVAKICLTHSFPNKSFRNNIGSLSSETIEQCKKILEKIEYDDYDRLIQLCDGLNKYGEVCTIEQRYEDISQRYKVSDDKIAEIIAEYNDLKRYFDNICGRDIYKIIGLNNENTKL